MKALLVADQADGGAERIARLLASELPAVGWSTHWPAPRSPAPPSPGPPSPGPPSPGSATFRPRLGFDLFAAWQVAQCARREQVDVVHVHGPRSLAAAWLSQVWGNHKPLVAHRHASYPLSPTAAWLARRADRWIVVCDAARREVTRAGVHPDRVDVVLPAAGRLFEENDSPVRRSRAGILVVGRLDHNKDPFAVLTAVDTLGDVGPLTFAGDGPLLRELARAAARRDATVVLGATDRVAELLQEAAVLVHAAHCEGVPLVLLEAAHLGTPIVATAVGGVPEVLRDRIDALLVPAGDPDALATAIAATLADPVGAATRAASARVRVRTCTGTAKLVAGCIRAYGVAISSNNRRA